MRNIEAYLESLYSPTKKKLEIAGLNIHVVPDVFTPNPKETYSSVMVLKELSSLKGQKVLDIGCGTGILSIAAAKEGAAKVMGIDVSKKAVETARKNSVSNGTEKVTSFQVQDFLEHFVVRDTFDLILANLPIYSPLRKKFIHALCKHANVLLKETGKILLSSADFDQMENLEIVLQEQFIVRKKEQKAVGITWYLYTLYPRETRKIPHFRSKKFESLLENTNEKQLIIETLDPLCKARGASCLDIGGARTAQFANKLSRYFERYVLLEKEQVIATVPKNVEVIESDFESFETTQRFDWIFASHVLYYFEDKKSMLEKMLSMLSKKGTLCIVLNGTGADYGPLKRHVALLSGRYYEFTYDILIRLLKDFELNIEEHTRISGVTFTSFEELFELLEFSFDLFTKEYSKTKTELLNFFSENYFSKVFTIEQKIILIKKKE